MSHCDADHTGHDGEHVQDLADGHGHGESRSHDHGHDHGGETGVAARLRHLVRPHSHQGTGRKIGSAALVADGLHARTDGLTSLAVLAGAGGVAIGWHRADPVVGLIITIAILAVLRQAARETYRRLVDAVDPALVDQVERTLRATSGVLDTGQVRVRWIGHQLRAEAEIVVAAADLSAVQAHRITVNAEHDLLHAIPRLAGALVHPDPDSYGTDPHDLLADHRDTPVPAPAHQHQDQP